MWEFVVKFFEYAPFYIGLVLIPAIIRTFIDTAVIKIPSSNFLLPPSKSELSVRNKMDIKYEDAFSSVVSSSLYAPLVEEMVFRASPYIFLGLPGLVVGNIVWILAHPSWQLRYVTGLPTEKKVAFTANTIFYYACASVFFSMPWLDGYGLIAIAYHMLHNGLLTLGGIFSEVEFPAPWKKEDSEFFRESRGLKKKLEERFFRDTNPPEEEINVEEEMDVDIGDKKFFKELSKKSISQKKSVPAKQVKRDSVKSKSVADARVDETLWAFWLK